MSARLRRGVVTAAAVFTVAYIAYAAAMIWAHPRLIYPFVQDVIEMPGYDRIEVPISGADPLPVMISDTPDGAEAGPTVIYFMGNAGSIGIFAPSLTQHLDAGRRVVAMTYRGGGGTPGEPSETRLKADALALFDWVQRDVGEGQVILHGYSFGTGLALHVAARRQVGGVILNAPYARMCDLMRAASRLPACHLPLVQRWESVEDARAIAEPVIISHGSEDRMIPIEQGARLAAALEADGTDVTYFAYPGLGHAGFSVQPVYGPRLEAWIAELVAE